MYIRDTIAAISTPVGEGGIGIIRISGDRAAEIAAKIFAKEESGGLKSHRFYYGEIKDPEVGATLDEAMAVLMLAPKSYTREDVVELQCHGGFLLLQKVLELVLRQGARLAEPGEFTKRAFLNGRIDLLQAEAVIDVIRGKTEAAIAVAQHQREGRLSERILTAREGVVHALALIEAYLDFPEEDIDYAESGEIAALVRDSTSRIEVLLDGFEEGRVLREGVSVLIAGKPNVGKSSLLNTLLQEKRAIVTSVPGTTRDVIEEVVNIRGLPVRILDTAGIRETEDLVEQEGVRLALEKVEIADLVLLLVDTSRPYDDDDRLVVETSIGRNVIVVKNKSDLPQVLNLPAQLLEKPSVGISTLTGEGIDGLRDLIFSTFMRRGAIDSRDYVVVTQSRHRDALLKAKRALDSFNHNLESGMNLEIVALDLREALQAVGEVTGETTPDDILDQIFQRFCIGK